jgi:hypothetical protein
MDEKKIEENKMEEQIKQINKKMYRIQVLLFLIVIYFFGSTLISFINIYIELKQKSIILQWELEKRSENF